jgi:hypothetical protein
MDCLGSHLRAHTDFSEQASYTAVPAAVPQGRKWVVPEHLELVRELRRRAALARGQPNILQTVALPWLRPKADTTVVQEENMVKLHGLLVPVSSTHHCASTPGLSTWSSTRSLQRSCDLGDLISWRVSRLDAFSVSPFRT